MSLGYDKTLFLEMFNADLVRFDIILSKFSCRWLDSRTVHLRNMNGLPFSGLRVNMYVISHYVRVRDVGIKDLLDGLRLYWAPIVD